VLPSILWVTTIKLPNPPPQLLSPSEQPLVTVLTTPEAAADTVVPFDADMSTPLWFDDPIPPGESLPPNPELYPPEVGLINIPFPAGSSLGACVLLVLFESEFELFDLDSVFFWLLLLSFDLCTSFSSCFVASSVFSCLLFCLASAFSFASFSAFSLASRSSSSSILLISDFACFFASSKAALSFSIISSSSSKLRLFSSISAYSSSNSSSSFVFLSFFLSN